MTQISILGCGWLGYPLAKAILKEGFSVKGSTTSVDKIPVLENAGIQPFLLSLSANETTGDLGGFLMDSSFLILNIPPKLRRIPKDTTDDPKKEFVEKMANLIPFIENSSVKKVLFVSSTSVYGNETSEVTEETATNPDTESGVQLVLVEDLFQGNSNFQTTVLRFGGLIGDDRQPGRFLAGKTNLDNPDASVNLIHQEDCIGLILNLISHTLDAEVWGATFNAVTPYHPSRKQYYTQKAIDLGLPLPEFNEENSSVGKTISSAKIQKVLGYLFKKSVL